MILNNLSTHSAMILLSSLKLLGLKLSVLEIWDTPLCQDIIQCLCEVLTNNNSIQKLVIRFYSISDIGVAGICNALRHNPTLTILDFYANPLITSASADTLAHFLVTNSILSELNLLRTSLSSESVLLLLQSLLLNKTLSTLRIDERHQIDSYPSESHRISHSLKY